MKTIITLVLMFLSLILFAEEGFIPADSLKSISIISKEETEKLSLFPEYQHIEQVRLFQTNSNQFYFEIIYKKDNLLLVDKYDVSLEQLQLIRKKIDDNKTISMKDYNKPADTFEYSDQKKDGNLLFVWGYSLLTVGFYGWSLPVSMMTNTIDEADQAAGASLVISGATIYVLAKSLKKLEISKAEASFSLDYAIRGLGHSYLLFNSIPDVKDSKAVPLLMSLISIAEGKIALNMARRYKLNSGQTAYTTLCHDIAAIEAVNLKSTILDDRYSKESSAAGILIASAVGTYAGLKRSDSNQYTFGDVQAMKSKIGMGMGIGYTLSRLMDTNKTIKFSLISGGLIAGLIDGERRSLLRDISKSDGYGLTLYTVSGSLIGLGSTLMIQNNNKNTNEKQCLVMSSIGALTGHYLYEKKLKRAYPKKEDDKRSKYSMDTFLNPMAYQTNHPFLSFRVEF